MLKSATLGNTTYECDSFGGASLDCTIYFRNHYDLQTDISHAIEDFINLYIEDDGKYPPKHYLSRIEDMTITDVQIISENKVVKVTFDDDTYEKAVCNELDTFSLERAIEICICKHLIGGTSKFNNAVRKGLKVYDNNIKAEEEAKAELERIEKRRAKHHAYRQKCKERTEQAEREKQIEIQKEAYLRAMREYKEETKEEKKHHRKDKSYIR